MLLTKKQKQSNSTQKGITVGVVTATMVAVLAAGGAWSRLNTQSDSMAASKAYQADAALNLMLAQVGQLQEAVKVATEKASISWTHVAAYNSQISLANATQAYVSDFAVPSVREPFIEQRPAVGVFKGFSRAPDSVARLGWHFGAVSANGYLAALAWLPLPYPELCVALNGRLGLGAAGIKLSNIADNLTKTPGESRAPLPAGHVAYTHLVNSAKSDKSPSLLEYQRLFRAQSGSTINQVQLPLGRHRARCITDYYGKLPALVVILYHGPAPTA